MVTSLFHLHPGSSSVGDSGGVPSVSRSSLAMSCHVLWNVDEVEGVKVRSTNLTDPCPGGFGSMASLRLPQGPNGRVGTYVEGTLFVVDVVMSAHSVLFFLVCLEGQVALLIELDGLLYKPTNEQDESESAS